MLINGIKVISLMPPIQINTSLMEIGQDQNSVGLKLLHVFDHVG